VYSALGSWACATLETAIDSTAPAIADKLAAATPLGASARSNVMADFIDASFFLFPAIAANHLW
jgi:hypothetical protein